MRPRAPLLLLMLGITLPILAVSDPAHAGGHLWLGSEFQGEGNIYRFNLATGMIDLVQAHAGVDHWNNMATGGGKLYLGHPTSAVLNQHDASTGALLNPGSYAPDFTGHKEDGAFHDGSIWRISFSGPTMVHRATTSGVAETTFTGSNQGFVGIAFIGDTLFATTYNGRQIGTLERTSATTMAFIVRPWAVGQQPSTSLGALAYDAEDDSLYMATTSDRLYRVWFDGGEAYSELVADLSTVGYPSGGLVDGMGWVPAGTVGVPAPRGSRSGGIELVAPWPNPARESVWFELRLPRATATRVGIYDVSGRVQRSWNLPGLGAGASRFMWDFRGPDGSRVPAGLYYVRVSTDQGEVSGRVVRVE